MIYFSDTTIIETYGDYQQIVHLMKSEGEPDVWCLSTDATVSESGIFSNYKLEFHSDGRVIISNTDRPVDNRIPDDDIRALADWANKSGWSKLCINNRLITDPAGFEFWLRIYRSGLIFSEDLQKYDQDEINRLSKFIDKEDEDD